MSFSTNLRRIREKRNFTQRELAKLAEVSHGLVAQLELGVKVPSLAVILRIAAPLGCTLDELVRPLD